MQRKPKKKPSKPMQTTEVIVSTSERWRAIVEGRPTEPIDVTVPDAGYYETVIGPRHDRRVACARILIRRTIFVETGETAAEDRYEAWVDGKRHEDIHQFIYWKPITLDRYRRMQKTAQENPEKMSLKFAKPLI